MEVLGRCLGPNRNNGNEICQAILHMNGQVIPYQSLRNLHLDELAPSNKSEAQKWAAFDEYIQKKLGNSMTIFKLTPEEKPETLEFVLDDDEQQGSDFFPEEYVIDAIGKPVKQKSTAFLMNSSEVFISQGEQ